jgi:hypothetical protein
MSKEAVMDYFKVLSSGGKPIKNWSQDLISNPAPSEYDARVPTATSRLLVGVV